MNKREKAQIIANKIDILHYYVETTHNPIIASTLSQKYHDIEQLGYDYNVFHQELKKIN